MRGEDPDKRFALKVLIVLLIGLLFFMVGVMTEYERTAVKEEMNIK